MKISVNWLNEYVDLSGISAKEIADKLTKITCEVEEVVEKGRGLELVKIGKVLTCESHPKSEHLHLLTVDIGDSKPLTIVCGAPNAREGIYVAVATIGTKLPNGLVINPVNVRGCDSFGMCCSYAELGYMSENEGIIELPENSKVGDSIENVLVGLKDEVLDIDNKSITNRPDLWGHYGIARDLSVIFDRKLKAIDMSIIRQFDNLPKLDIQLENENCLSYGAIKIENIGNTVSPNVIQNRLYYLGHSSHGFMVDLTNYVMLAFGNPIHSFDATSLDKISIGNIQEGEKFLTLKDNEIIASKEMLFIKSNGKPVALAGIMGGKNSEIKPNTKDAIFEVATFDATNIRLTSVKVGIRSDASMRYEKALDPETNWIAAAEILRLVKKYSSTAKVVSAFTRVTSSKAIKPENKITLSKKRLENYTGVCFENHYDTVQKNLQALGFQPKISKDEISVTVPSYRSWKDVTNAADIIEEIVRNYGYENILPIGPKVQIAPIPLDKYAIAKDKIKDILANKYSFSEVHTHIWYDTRSIKNMGLTVNSYATIANAFVKDDDKVRSEMLPSMLTMALSNRLQSNVRIFEIGRILNSDSVEEEHFSGVCLSQSYKKVSEILTDIFSVLGLTLDYKINCLSTEVLHPTNNAKIFLGKQEVGRIGIIHPRIINDAVGFEINLSKIDFTNVAPCEAPVISKFPKTELDFTFIWNKTYSELDQIFTKFENKMVIKRRLTDVYENKFTMTFTVSSTEKTLDKEEIGNIHKEIVDFADKNSVHLNK